MIDLFDTLSPVFILAGFDLISLISISSQLLLSGFLLWCRAFWTLNLMSLQLFCSLRCNHGLCSAVDYLMIAGPPRNTLLLR